MANADTLSLTDIAALARVQRPVVSTWRTRPRARGVEIPFPTPVTTIGRTERFDRDEIVSWLEATGRGNNNQARLDAPTFAVPDDVRIEDVVCLICLSEFSGEQLAGRSQSGLVALAERADPHDRLLLDEVRALEPAPELMEYVDALIAASFGPIDAIERAERSRVGRAGGGRGVRDELIKLVETVLEACRGFLAGDDTVLALHGDTSMLPTAEGFAGVHIEAGAETRAMRRQIALRGVDEVDRGGSAVHLLGLLGVADLDALDAVDRLVLDLDQGDIGVVIGPAALLCDQLLGEAELRRATTLRDGKLALALRLPRGLWREAHRQSLAIWVLRGGEREERLRVADLDTVNLALEDLASDVAGALSRSADRAYRYSRSVDLARVLARGPVVPRGARALQFSAAEPSTLLERVQAATLLTSGPIPAFDVAVTRGPGQLVIRSRSLRDLELANQLVMRRGCRVDRAMGVQTGTVPVIAADGSTDDLWLDPFDAARTYRTASRTEPGDVVFMERPRPQAVVDTGGGALVASPSRVLRLLPGAAIGPHALAAVINGLPAIATEWPTWNVPDLQKDAAAALDAALIAASQHLRVLRAHERATHDLTRNLVDGVAAGAITIDPVIRKEG